MIAIKLRLIQTRASAWHRASQKRVAAVRLASRDRDDAERNKQRRGLSGLKRYSRPPVVHARRAAHNVDGS